MQTQTQPQDKSKLDSFIWVPKIMDDHDVSFGVTNVYSYMLCKYTWFCKQGRDYYESQESISEGSRTAIASTKTAIKWLRENGFIMVTKKKGALHFNNQYIVKDTYCVYSRQKDVPNKKLFEQELDEIKVPF